jgi:hypothetical protein
VRLADISTKKAQQKAAVRELELRPGNATIPTDKGTGSAMSNDGHKNVSTSWLAAAAAILGFAWVVGFAPAPAAAQGTPEQQQACTPDVMRLCNAFVPDVAKITVCMKRNWASVSPACRVALHPPHTSTRVSHHHAHHASHH